MKICVLGYSRSGKTTAAKLLADHLGVNYADTSDQLIKEMAEHLGIKQSQIRDNKEEYRQQLYDFGRSRQETDQTWPQNIQIQFADVIVGLRNPYELKYGRHYYDLVVWIDRPGVVANQTDTLDKDSADEIIVNDGSIDDLRNKLAALIQKYQSQ